MTEQLDHAKIKVLPRVVTAEEKNSWTRKVSTPRFKKKHLTDAIQAHDAAEQPSRIRRWYRLYGFLLPKKKKKPPKKQFKTKAQPKKLSKLEKMYARRDAERKAQIEQNANRGYESMLDEFKDITS